MQPTCPEPWTHRRRSIEQDRSGDSSYKITCNMVEIYNEVVHDLLFKDAKRQVDLQKTPTGFSIPSITQVGASDRHLTTRVPKPQT